MYKPKNPILSKLDDDFTRKKKIEYNQGYSDKWATNFDKSCPNLNNISKIQPFKNYNFFNRNMQNDNDVNNYKNFYVENDNIAIRPLKLVGHTETLKLLEAKSLFGSHHESLVKSWIPKMPVSINNRSSVAYNILSPENKKEQQFWAKKVDQSLRNVNINNRQKSITEFADLTSPGGLRFNDDFEKEYSKNPNLFKKYLGVFTNMYEVSQRCGNLSVPFHKSSDFEIGRDHIHESPKKITYCSRRKKKID